MFCQMTMYQCFGSAHSSPVEDDFKYFLKMIFLDINMQAKMLSSRLDETSYSNLKKAGKFSVFKNV